MTEIIRNKWCEDLEDLLQCPICMTRPKTSVYQCIEGHHICEDCKTRLSLCPACKQRWSSGRVRLVENLCSKLDDIKLSLIDPESEVNKLLIPEQANVASQTEDETPADLGPFAKSYVDEHEGLYPCRITGCKENLYYASLMNHLQIEHRTLYMELSMEHETFQYRWHFDFVEQLTFDRAFFIPGLGTFFLKLSSDVFGNLTGLVLMLHKEFVAKQFIYHLAISCCDEHLGTSINYHGELCSCRTPVKSLQRNCLQISYMGMQSILEHRKNLTCTVLICQE